LLPGRRRPHREVHAAEPDIEATRRDQQLVVRLEVERSERSGIGQPALPVENRRRAFGIPGSRLHGLTAAPAGSRLAGGRSPTRGRSRIAAVRSAKALYPRVPRASIAGRFHRHRPSSSRLPVSIAPTGRASMAGEVDGSKAPDLAEVPGAAGPRYP